MSIITNTSPVIFSDLHQLELRVDQAQCDYNTISAKVEECWQLFDEAIEAGDEDRNLIAETAEMAEKIKHDAYEDLQLAKASLLAYWQ